MTDEDARFKEIEARDFLGRNTSLDLPHHGAQKNKEFESEQDFRFINAFFKNTSFSPETQAQHIRGLEILARAAAEKHAEHESDPETQEKFDSFFAKLFETHFPKVQNKALGAMVVAYHAHDESCLYETALFELEDTKLTMTKKEESEVIAWRFTVLDDLREKQNMQPPEREEKIARMTFHNQLFGDRIRAKQKKMRALTREIQSIATSDSASSEKEIAKRVTFMHKMMLTEFTVSPHLKMTQPLIDTWKESLKSLAPLKSEAVLQSMLPFALAMKDQFSRHEVLRRDTAEVWTSCLQEFSGRKALCESFRAVLKAPHGDLASRMEGSFRQAVQKAEPEDLFLFGIKNFNLSARVASKDGLAEIERRLGRLGAILDAGWKKIPEPTRDMGQGKKRLIPVNKFEPLANGMK